MVAVVNVPLEAGRSLLYRSQVSTTVNSHAALVTQERMLDYPIPVEHHPLKWLQEHCKLISELRVRRQFHL